MKVEYEIDITLKFDEKRGYYMITKKSKLAKRDLPGLFTNATRKGDKIIYDSLDLCKMNAKLQHSLNEIYVLSLDTIVTLNDNIREYIGCLYKVCEGIAMLDMVFSPPRDRH
jgi:DNA mismatch repair protein MSH4